MAKYTCSEYEIVFDKLFEKDSLLNVVVREQNNQIKMFKEKEAVRVTMINDYSDLVDNQNVQINTLTIKTDSLTTALHKSEQLVLPGIGLIGVLAVLGLITVFRKKH